MTQRDSLNDIPPKVQRDWQAILDLLSQICDVPAALIMRVSSDEIEVFAKSSNEDNPYKVGATEALKGELYCEHVLKIDAELLVPNALKDEKWKDNPDIALSMISYCGLPIHWPDGTHFGTICILDRKENAYSETFRGLLASYRDSVENSLELIEALRLKDNILSIAAHDLRSPLAQVEGLAELMLSQLEEGQGPIDAIIPGLINRSVASMRELVEQLLMAQEVESLKGQIRKERFDLPALLRECVAETDYLLEAKQQVLVKEWLGELSVQGGYLYIKDAVINLISNASKYSPSESEIRLAVQLDGKDVVIHVIDEGPGFAIEDHGKMFGKFQKLSATPTNKETSTGLGLYIVKCIAEMHGGRVFPQSVSGKGAHMVFTWSGLEESS